MKSERVFVPERSGFVPAGERPGYPTDDAVWITHPDADGRSPIWMEFTLNASVSDGPLTVHVTADQRFDLFLDEELIASGPDAGDLRRWPFASYRVEATPGAHRFCARVWWIGGHAPLARFTHRPAFLLRADGPNNQGLSTGRAPWRVRAFGGWSFTKPDLQAYIAVGDPQVLDLRAWETSAPAVPAVPLGPALHPNNTGLITLGWQLTPTPLPEQYRRVHAPGRIRAVRADWVADDDLFTAADAAATGDWPALLAGGAEITIPPGAAVTALWDLDDYYCGWPLLGVRGGRDAEVEFGWAESLMEAPPRRKGNRDAVVGKRFFGMTDRFLLDGAERTLEPLWWRAGRYFRLRIRAGANALTMTSLALRETRYPLENKTFFVCDDPSVESIERLSLRGLQMCAHEHYMDCPYYEQLMYVGDTRIEALLTYALTDDDRLPRRAIRLFNDSRSDAGGLTGSRYPCRDPQIIPTFSMFWVGMVRDFLYWRDDLEFVRQQIPGVRSVAAELERYELPDGVPGRLPGWVFTDWVREWPTGYPPNSEVGPSSTIALVYLQMLENVADIENAAGDPALARRSLARAKRLRAALVRRFWDPRRRLMADDPERRSHSEHAQTLGLLARAIPAGERRAVLRKLRSAELAPRATVYFTHYVFEALAAAGEGGAIPDRLELWRGLAANGLRTAVETTLNGRSDCHGWSSSPLLHLRTGVAGIRPSAPGFRQIQVRPQPGPWRRIAASVCHPRGRVEAQLSFDGKGGIEGRLRLPARTEGVLIWNGRRHQLKAGTNRVRV